jgi:hypothetical protein
MMTVVRGLPVLLLSACALGGDPYSTTQQEIGGNASVSLRAADASISQTAATSWSLAKTGSVDASAKTITWQITATQGTTVGGQLHITGQIAVTNTGSGPATIGNILVNLQTKSGSSWVTRSSDVNDATSGDAATTAHIFSQASSEGRSVWAENGASGSLQFTDANTNTLFSLVPEVTIPQGATVPLLFEATFDNNVLHLASGTAVRAEVIVSFGNHGSHGNAGANIDINGNGVIDADEAYVRSVPARLGLAVPAQTGTTGTPTLADALSDITSTGTVTLSNASFNLGATTGTATVHYDPGTDGGDITNCAHLTGGGGLNLQACNTQSVTGTGGGGGCTDGQPGCGWKSGDLTTYSQVTWPDDATARAIAINNFNTVYASSFGVMEVGIPGTAGFSMRFDSGTAVLTYVPANGLAAALTADLFDPTTSASGTFGGEVVALQLNVDFSSYTAGTSGLPFGGLTVCGVSTTSLNGLTVGQVLADANVALGGGTTVASLTDLNALAQNLNAAFLGGVPSTFAQQHLVSGTCP